MISLLPCANPTTHSSILLSDLSYLFSQHLPLPEFISYGKVRVSYAKIGKDALPYSTTTGYSPYSPSSTGLPSGVTGVTRGANLGDPNLRPEFTNTIEAGLGNGFSQ